MKRKGKRSILSKLLLGICIPVVLVFLVAGLMIVNNIDRSVSNLTMQNLSAQSAAASSQVNEFFTQYLSGTQKAAANSTAVTFLKNEHKGVRAPNTQGYPEIKQTLDSLTATDSKTILASWLADFDSSQSTQSDGFTTPEDWDITTRPWYAVKSTKQPVLTEPYVDASTGGQIISAAAPVFDPATNEPIGALGFDIKLDQLEKTMSSYKIGKTGFVIFCSADNQILQYPDQSYKKKNITESNLSKNAMEAIQNVKTGDITYTLGGKTIHGSLSKVGITGWTVLTGLPDTEFQQTSHQVTTLIITIFMIGLAALILFILFFARGIINPLKKLAVVTQKIAEGDLNVEVDTSRTDETGQVALAMANTVKRLKQYINYIDELSGVLNRIAQGNLVFELKYDYAGEFAKLKEALLNIQSTLTKTLGDISQSAQQVSSGSEQISNGAQALSQGATEQASSIQELSASITEISSQVTHNAESSSNASSSVEKVKQEVEQSNVQMKEMISAMSDINASSNEIGKIIKTIEDIAFQTNILALNAAVEAARAGEAGKGFAVVADEVRNLAQKSAEASKNTSVLIERSMQAVDHGTQIADETAHSLSAVVEGTESVSSTVSKIADATKQQADSIAQVTQGMEQISAVVQTNSATAEQSAAASEELSGQAEILKELVTRFRLENANGTDIIQS